MRKISLIQVKFTIVDPKAKGSYREFYYTDRFVTTLTNNELVGEELQSVLRKTKKKLFSPTSKKEIKSIKVSVIRDMSEFLGLVKNPNLNI